jgi:hypothetical protein
MWQYVIKVVVSAIIITAVSEISKRSSFWGGVLASVPLLSVIAIIWLYTETKSVEKVSQLSGSIFWLVIPSLSLFIILPYLLKQKIDFYFALVISVIAMILFYYAMIFILAKFGVKI